jgi:hypothetical protein
MEYAKRFRDLNKELKEIYESAKRSNLGRVIKFINGLGDSYSMFKTEIVLSRPPCSYCLKFQDWFQRYQPIKFPFIIYKNLGKVRL